MKLLKGLLVLAVALALAGAVIWLGIAPVQGQAKTPMTCTASQPEISVCIVLAVQDGAGKPLPNVLVSLGSTMHKVDARGIAFVEVPMRHPIFVAAIAPTGYEPDQGETVKIDTESVRVLRVLRKR